MADRILTNRSLNLAACCIAEPRVIDLAALLSSATESSTEAASTHSPVTQADTPPATTDGMTPNKHSTYAEEQKMLLAEAASTAAPRLLIQHLHVGRLELLCEVHVSAGVSRLPVSVDTHRSASCPPC